MLLLQRITPQTIHFTPLPNPSHLSKLWTAEPCPTSVLWHWATKPGGEALFIRGHIRGGGSNWLVFTLVSTKTEKGQTAGNFIPCSFFNTETSESSHGFLSTLTLKQVTVKKKKKKTASHDFIFDVKWSVNALCSCQINTHQERTNWTIKTLKFNWCNGPPQASTYYALDVERMAYTISPVDYWDYQSCERLQRLRGSFQN